jgi:hypothetical protein
MNVDAYALRGELLGLRFFTARLLRELLKDKRCYVIMGLAAFGSFSMKGI